jgi:hypothetical protein
MRFLSLALAFLFATPMQLTSREREAFEHLRKIEQVQMPYVGFASAYSGGYLAMRILGRSRSADTAFKALIEKGTLAGQLYGLAGVQRTDPAYYRRVAPKYTSMTEPVLVFAGCVIAPEPVRSIAGQLDIFTAPARDENDARRAEETYKFR